MPSSTRATAAAAASAAEATAAPPKRRVLKKYPNRRLYDTRSSSYITLADVKKMVLDGEAFEVRDAKTGDDLTRSILLQIILEEESGGVPMFTTQALEQIIRFYGHAMQGMMGTLLERNLQAFTEMQAQFLGGQGIAIQGLFERYLEQTRAMAEQFGKAGSVFPGMTGFPPKR